MHRLPSLFGWLLGAGLLALACSGKADAPAAADAGTSAMDADGTDGGDAGGPPADAGTAVTVSDCPPGTWFEALGRSCRACRPGTFCPGAQAAYAPCESGTWDHDASPATACVAWTTCPVGTFVQQEGSTTADRTCTPCPAGTTNALLDSPRCVPAPVHDGLWEICPPGQRSRTPPTEGVGVQCESCLAFGTVSVCLGGDDRGRSCLPGTWDQDHSIASDCVAWSTCGAGFRVGAQGSATSDRTCERCAEGTWSAQENSPACVPQGTCAPGLEWTGATDAAGNDVCRPCSGEAGVFCAGGRSAAAACTTGETDHDHNPATPCLFVKRVCPPGQYVLSEGDATTDRTCAACPPQTYSLQENQPSCLPQPSCEPPSPYDLRQEGSPTRRRYCGAIRDCELTAWTGWSACSLPCETGTQTRSRSVLREASPRGGCDPNLVQSRACNAGVTCTCAMGTSATVCVALPATSECQWRNGACTWLRSITPCDQIITEARCVSSPVGCLWFIDTCVAAGP